MIQILKVTWGESVEHRILKDFENPFEKFLENCVQRFWKQEDFSSFEDKAHWCVHLSFLWGTGPEVMSINAINQWATTITRPFLQSEVSKILETNFSFQAFQSRMWIFLEVKLWWRCMQVDSRFWQSKVPQLHFRLALW